MEPITYEANPIPNENITIVQPIINNKLPSNGNTPKFKSLLLLIPLLVLSSIAVFFFVIKPKLNSSQNEKQIIVLPTPKPFFLTIDKPKNEATLINDEVLVAGKTYPNTTVIIFSDTDETAIESDVNGTFTGTILVSNLGGLVRVAAYADNGEEKSQTLIISKNNQVLGKSDAPGQNKENTNASSSNSNKENKEEKPNQQNQETEKNELKNNTENKDIKSSPQAKTNNSNQEKTISKFLQTKTNSPKITKLGETKIKDLLSMEGTASAKLNKQYKIQKMMIAEASSGAALKRHALSGVIVSVSNGTLTLAHQIQRDRIYKVYYNSNTIITGKNLSDKAKEASNSAKPSSENTMFTVGMRIAAVGEPVGEDLLAKRIHIIPGKATGIFKRLPVASESGMPIASGSATPKASIKPSPTIPATTKPSSAPTP